MKTYIIASTILLIASASSLRTNLSRLDRLDIEKRIFSEKQASTTGFPWMVKIISYDWSLYQLSWEDICSGTYIHEWWVLTAATCVIKDRTDIPPEPYYVVYMFMGFGPDDTYTSQKRRAVEFRVYPKYIQQAEGSIRVYPFNLVLIRPDAKFILNDRVQIDKNFHENPGTGDRESCVIGFGYGRRKNLPHELLIGYIQDFERDVKHIKNKVKDIFEVRKTICFGDVGGPLYWGAVQVGVATRYVDKGYHPDSCGLGRYVNIRNKEVYSWIQGKMEKAKRRSRYIPSSGVSSNSNLCCLLEITSSIVIIVSGISLNLYKYS